MLGCVAGTCEFFGFGVDLLVCLWLLRLVLIACCWVVIGLYSCSGGLGLLVEFICWVWLLASC